MDTPYLRWLDMDLEPRDEAPGGDPPCWAHMLDDEGRVIGDGSLPDIGVDTITGARDDAHGPGDREPSAHTKP